MKLCKPKNKGDIVSSIESMPKCTYSKHIYLTYGLILEMTPLVNTFSQPLLYQDVPIVNLLPHMDSCLDNDWVGYVDTIEIMTIIADSRRVNCTHTKLPAEVILASGQSNCHKYIDEDVEI